jgi:carbon monoxide dehydrogenase subunit G
MKLTNEFTVRAPIEQAWAVLTDLEAVAPCLPGARLTGVDAGVHSGRIKVKVGPVVSEFAGTAVFVEKDEASYRGVIDAKGRDSRSGNAAALVTARLRPDGDGTVVTVDTDLKISGKLAQFGTGMIKEVSAKLLGQFVTALEAKLEAGAASQPAAPQPAASQPTAPLAAAALAGTAPAAGPGVEGTGAVGPGAGGEWPGPAGDEWPGPEPLDLMELAGRSLYRRMVPVLAGVVIVAAAVVVYRRVR